MGISPGPAGRQRRTAIEPLERAIHPCCSNSSKGWIMRLFDRSLHFLLFAYLFCSSVHIANEAVEKKLDNVKTIYVIPMKDRLEHFLTNEIVKWGQFEVTLNPREADVLLSDTTDVNVKELLSDSAKIRRTTSRTRGTAFLIDMKTEKVLWSAAKKPSGSFLGGGDKSARELAQEIVGQLKKDVG